MLDRQDHEHEDTSQAWTGSDRREVKPPYVNQGYLLTVEDYKREDSPDDDSSRDIDLQ